MSSGRRDAHHAFAATIMLLCSALVVKEVCNKLELYVRREQPINITFRFTKYNQSILDSSLKTPIKLFVQFGRKLI